MADDATIPNGDDKSLREFAHRAEQAARESAEELRRQAQEYFEEGRHRLDEAQRILVERVKEKPVESALVTFGVGVIVGLILGGGRRH